MPTRYKILLVLLAGAITAVLYFIVTSNPEGNFSKKISGLSIRNADDSEPEEVDLAELSEEYKEGISEAFSEFLALNESADLGVPRIEEIKNKVLELRLPAEFKDLHLDFILALTRIEGFLETGSEEAMDAGDDLIEKIKTDYPWLYNTI